MAKFSFTNFSPSGKTAPAAPGGDASQERLHRPGNLRTSTSSSQRASSSDKQPRNPNLQVPRSDERLLIPGKPSPGLNAQPLNYNEYHFTAREYLAHFLQALAVDAAFSFVFYRSLMFFLFLLPAAVWYPFFKKRDLIPARKRTLLLQFREALSVLAGTLSAGYSMENALLESTRELRLLLGGEAYIVREFELLSHLVSMNIPVEKAMDEFAERAGIDDIRNFARVLRVAKRSGGDLVPIMNQTADTISDRIQMKEDILTITASRRFEQNIMNLVPLLLVIYVDFSNPGFFTVMYTTVVGRAVMTGCLAVYLLSVGLSWKILNIEL